MSNFCNTDLSGIPIGCDAALGGIKEVFVVPYTALVTDEDKSTSAFSVREATVIKNDIIEDFFTNAGSLSDYFRYRFKRETGNFETTVTKEENGAIFYESTINLVFGKQEVSKKKEIEQLAKGDLAMLVRDNNNKVWVFGMDYPVRLSEGTVETGTAFGDFNGYNLTFSDFSREMPYELGGMALEDLNSF